VKKIPSVPGRASAHALFKIIPQGKLLAGLGVLSSLLYWGMTLLSRQFNWGEGYAQRPILTYLGVYFSLFALYAAAVWLVAGRKVDDRRSFLTLVAFGLLFRALLFPSQQIQEDDIYRYLWDGKVFAHGVNPYAYAPAEVQQYQEFRISEPERFSATYDEESQKELERLNRLKWESRQALTVLDRVNHPDVPTIYPPLAQFVFAATAMLKADSIGAMRMAFLLFDLAVLGFLVLLLRALGKNPNLCLIYFWSPLVIKETFNSTHLDIIGIALLTGSIYFLVARRHALATVFLGLSFLGKLYPIILLPLYLQQAALQVPAATRLQAARRILSLTLLFAAVVILGYLPFMGTGLKTFEGLKTFSTYWQSNDSLFSLLVYFFRDILKLGGEGQTFLSQSWPTLAAKATVFALLVFCLAWLLFRRRATDQDTAAIRPLFVIMALVFVLSPVQNPWYLLWLVPFLCIYPRRAWILLTGLAGLYYLDFYFDYQDIAHQSAWTPWIEYTPFYLLLAWDFTAKWRTRRLAMGKTPSAPPA